MTQNQSPLNSIAAIAFGEEEHAGAAAEAVATPPSGPTFADLGLSADIVSIWIFGGVFISTPESIFAVGGVGFLPHCDKSVTL